MSGPASTKFPPLEGWTDASAGDFCDDILRSGQAYQSCRGLINVNAYSRDCKLDLLFSGNPKIANLHLEHMKVDCIEEKLTAAARDENRCSHHLTVYWFFSCINESLKQMQKFNYPTVSFFLCIFGCD